MRATPRGGSASRFLLFLCAVMFGPQLLPLEWQDFIQLQLTTQNLAWNTIWFSPLAGLANAALLAWVVSLGRLTRESR